MSDYSVVAADGSKSFGTFDKYRPARELHQKLSKKQSVNLLCLHGCGCVYRAIVKGRTVPGGQWSPVGDIEIAPTHTGWRRAEACAKHRRSQPFEKHGLDDTAIEAEKKREAAATQPGGTAPKEGTG